MPDMPLSQGWILTDSAGADTATSSASTITSGSGSMGSWTEIIASTSANSNHIMLFFTHDVSTPEEFLIDIGVGPSSEQVIIESMTWSGRQDATTPVIMYSLPISIGAGTRVVMRAQATAATTLKYIVNLYANSATGAIGRQSAKGYGIVTASSRGTAVDPGATPNTKPTTYTELVASTGEDIYGFVLMIGNNDNAVIGAASSMLFDIAVGAASSESNIIADHWCVGGTSELNTGMMFYDIFIPAGTRISARMQSTEADATDRIRTVALLGIN